MLLYVSVLFEFYVFYFKYEDPRSKISLNIVGSTWLNLLRALLPKSSSKIKRPEVSDHLYFDFISLCIVTARSWKCQIASALARQRRSIKKNKVGRFGIIMHARTCDFPCHCTDALWSEFNDLHDTLMALRSSWNRQFMAR